MILSEQKPFDEIIAYLEKDKNVFIMGCKGCAQSSGSGGPKQVEEMKKKLTEAGKNVTGTKAVDFLCGKALIKSELKGKIDQLKGRRCGAGVDLRYRRPVLSRRRLTSPFIRAAIRSTWAAAAANGKAASAVTSAASACCTIPAVSAPSPPAPRAWSAAPAAGPTKASVRSPKTATAAGS